MGQDLVCVEIGYFFHTSKGKLLKEIAKNFKNKEYLMAHGILTENHKGYDYLNNLLPEYSFDIIMKFCEHMLPKSSTCENPEDLYKCLLKRLNTGGYKYDIFWYDISNTYWKKSMTQFVEIAIEKYLEVDDDSDSESLEIDEDSDFDNSSQEFSKYWIKIITEYWGKMITKYHFKKMGKFFKNMLPGYLESEDADSIDEFVFQNLYNDTVTDFWANMKNTYWDSIMLQFLRDTINEYQNSDCCTNDCLSNTLMKKFLSDVSYDNIDGDDRWFGKRIGAKCHFDDDDDDDNEERTDDIFIGLFTGDSLLISAGYRSGPTIYDYSPVKCSKKTLQKKGDKINKYLSPIIDKYGLSYLYETTFGQYMIGNF